MGYGLIDCFDICHSTMIIKAGKVAIMKISHAWNIGGLIVSRNSRKMSIPFYEWQNDSCKIHNI